MKNSVFITLCMIVLITGCQKDNQQVTPATNYTSNSSNPSAARSSANQGLNSETRYVSNWSKDLTSRASCGTGSKFIPVLEANAMIGSYLYSIHSEKNDSDLHSFSVDADQLRAYLADSSVKNVKLIFAHTVEYMKAGNEGRYAGLQSGAMTIIITGYDVKGNYVFHNGMVLDHLIPCPYSCPPGAASNDLLY